MNEMNQSKLVPVSCNRDCITGCPLEAIVEGEKIVRIRNNPERSKYMNGCARGLLFSRVVYHSDRILHPLIRRGERGSGDFRRASWEEALDMIAGRLNGIKQAYGSSAVMRLGGGGACRGAFHHTHAVPARFFAYFGGYTDITSSFSSAATDFVKPFMYGTKYVGVDAKTLLQSKLVLLWGFNAADTRFGPETEGVLEELRQKGVPIVVIDPRKTRTVRRFDAEWFPIYPGSDSALMLGILWVLLDRGEVDRSFIQKYSVGFEELEAYIHGEDGSEPKTPLWASGHCGLAPESIEKLASMYASIHPVALLAGLSIQRTLGGEDADRLAGVLQLATGNVGIPGGSAGTGQWNVVRPPVCGRLPVPENPAASSVPVYQWADAVLDGGNYGLHTDIRCLYNVGGNYLVQGSDVKKNIRAFRKVDFVVTHDYFLTDTALYSDVVLPVTTFVERSDILFSHTNYLYYSRQAIEPSGEARNDWDIFLELSRRLGFEEEFSDGKSPDQWLRYFLRESEVEDIEAFTRTGIYRGDMQYQVGLSDFISDPVKHPLRTESGKIEVACPSYERVGGGLIPRFDAEQEGSEGSEVFRLALISPHERMRNNSQFDNIEEFRRSVDNTVWVNPADAEPRGLHSGDPVVLFNDIGSVHAEARVTGDTMRGVLVYHQGGWETRGGSSSNSVNNVTSTTPTFPSRGARTHSIKVELCKKDEYISPDG